MATGPTGPNEILDVLHFGAAYGIGRGEEHRPMLHSL